MLRAPINRGNCGNKMTSVDVIHAWDRIPEGKRPSLSIEITREWQDGALIRDGHFGGDASLRRLADRKGWS